MLRRPSQTSFVLVAYVPACVCDIVYMHMCVCVCVRTHATHVNVMESVRSVGPFLLELSDLDSSSVQVTNFFST